MQDFYLFILLYKLAHVKNTHDCVREIETSIDGQVHPQAKLR